MSAAAIATLPLIGGEVGRRRHARRLRRARREAVGRVVDRSGAVGVRAGAGRGHRQLSGGDRHRHLGTEQTVGWAFDITNFVFWIGIGHAGTLISAILFLLRQRWRTSVNRAAEAMTLFAVMCAGLFPLIHMGRPWLSFWMLPYPNTRGPLWINFRSPLVWDFFAISTYFTISAIFWYIGLLPDLATIRDRAGTARGRLARSSPDPRICRAVEPRLERRLLDLAPLRGGVSAAGGARDAPRALRAQHRQHGFRHCGGARLAHHDLPAVFRRRRDKEGESAAC